MITVELDIFSGNPNPRWTLTPKEENELIARVMAEPSLTSPPKSAGGLGYRGFTISTDNEAKRTLEKSGLPSRFYIESKENVDAELALINSTKAEKMTADEVRQVALDSIKKTNQVWSEYWKTHPTNESFASDRISSEGYEPSDLKPDIPLDTAPPAENAVSACGPVLVSSDTDFSFWNDAYSITRNNCYNFASGYRSHTFAQPGRKSGVALTSLANCGSSVGSVSYCASFDGFSTTCYTGNQFYACLVLWANNDFHWYRLCANSHWCHKPGGTAARNYDDSGFLIADPATCNRGPYTLVCSYRYFPYGWTVN